MPKLNNFESKSTYLRTKKKKEIKEHQHNNFILQEVTGDDDSDLYLLEREAELKSVQEAKRLFQMSVPGILGPHELPEDMQDE